MFICAFIWNIFVSYEHLMEKLIKDVCICLADLKKNPVDGFSAGLIDDDNLFQWEVMILGPPDTF